MLKILTPLNHLNQLRSKCSQKNLIQTKLSDFLCVSMINDALLNLLDKGLRLLYHNFLRQNCSLDDDLFLTNIKFTKLGKRIKLRLTFLLYFQDFRYLDFMADLFPCLKQKTQKRSGYFQKRKVFQKQIRDKHISEKIRQKRIVGNDGPHIEAMVKALPLSWQDTAMCMKQNPKYCEFITKLIIDKVYPVQLSEKQISENNSIHFLVPENPPETLPQFINEVYFFAVLLEYQGIYSPKILRRYLLILLEHGRSVNGLHLIFNIFIEVLKKPQLNWAPIEQIDETIHWIDKQKEQKQNNFSRQEVETYFLLVTHYYPLTQKFEEIRNRIKLILQAGADSFQDIKPSLLFKLCFQLTHYENSKEQAQKNNESKNEIEPNRFFHQAMIKGGIIKSIYRHLFFSQKEKLKYLCLDLLNNLIIEYDGMILWAEQSTNPIQKFEQQIRDQSNSMNLFKQFCSVFLTSILELPCNQITKLFQKQTDTLQLILYILQKVDHDSYRGQQIHEKAYQSLIFLLNEGNSQIQQKIVHTILYSSSWKIALAPDSDLIFQCQKRASLQPGENFFVALHRPRSVA